MKIYTVRVAAVDTINNVRGGAVSFEGVFAPDEVAAQAFGAFMALKLYDWDGPGMSVVVFQTGEENRR